MPKMNPEIKAKWLEALRSGDYMQGMYFLRQHDKFCFLGVLCDLAVKDGIITESNSGDIFFYSDDEDMHLPQEVQD